MSDARRERQILIKLVESGKITQDDLRKLQIEVPAEIDGSTWRKGCYSLDEMPNVPPRFILGGLIPEKALTLITAPSYNGKTWFALQMALAASRGEDLWCFPGPKDSEGKAQKVPVIYHIPELAAAYVRERATMLGIANSEDFLFRPMELGLWPMNDPRMLASAAGRLVILDTVGYFNPSDDIASYTQAIQFALLVHNLIVAGGALAVVGLHHPTKAASRSENGKSGPEQNWTLENSILGSAGYGGVLRSCLRTKNLNSDLNDMAPWLYVQGLKNPGLKPFQLEGAPLRMKVAPGDSPYLSEILREKLDPQEELLRELVRAGEGVNATERALKERFKEKAWSHGKVCERHKAVKAEIGKVESMPETEDIPF